MEGRDEAVRQWIPSALLEMRHGSSAALVAFGCEAAHPHEGGRHLLSIQTKSWTPWLFWACLRRICRCARSTIWHQW